VRNFFRSGPCLSLWPCLLSQTCDEKHPLHPVPHQPYPLALARAIAAVQFRTFLLSQTQAIYTGSWRQLVWQLLAAYLQQQAPAARALVQFCVKQGSGQEWQDASCRAGALAALAQAARIADTAIQRLSPSYA